MKNDPRTRFEEKPLSLKLTNGTEGMAVYLNGVRIAGPRSTGGGRLLREWKVDAAEFWTALSADRDGMASGEITLDKANAGAEVERSLPPTESPSTPESR